MGAPANIKGVNHQHVVMKKVGQDYVCGFLCTQITRAPYSVPGNLEDVRSPRWPDTPCCQRVHNREILSEGVVPIPKVSAKRRPRDVFTAIFCC